MMTDSTDLSPCATSTNFTATLSSVTSREISPSLNPLPALSSYLKHYEALGDLVTVAGNLRINQLKLMIAIGHTA